MKHWTRWMVAGLLLAPLTGPRAAVAEETGICLVCQVNEGEAAPEPVRAARAHEGKAYGFCSEKCAKAFEADPIAYLPPIFPRPAPAFAFTTFSGDPASNESLKGKIVLIDFWATWCAPCRRSMPALQALHEKYKGRGVVVLGVSVDQGGDGKPRTYVASKRFTYPMAMDSETSPVWEAFGVKAIPAAFLLDRDGRVVGQWTGAMADAREIEARLEELFAKR